VRGRIPWFGTLANHAGIVVPAVAGGLVMQATGRTSEDLPTQFLSTLLGSALYFALNISLVSLMVSLRNGDSFGRLLSQGLRSIAANLLALAPLAWLMTRMYSLEGAGWWATLLFALPLYTTRVAYNSFVEMRDMFTQT